MYNCIFVDCLRNSMYYMSEFMYFMYFMWLCFTWMVIIFFVGRKTNKVYLSIYLYLFIIHFGTQGKQYCWCHCIINVLQTWDIYVKETFKYITKFSLNDFLNGFLICHCSLNIVWCTRFFFLISLCRPQHLQHPGTSRHYLQHRSQSELRLWNWFPQSHSEPSLDQPKGR